MTNIITIPEFIKVFLFIERIRDAQIAVCSQKVRVTRYQSSAICVLLERFVHLGKQAIGSVGVKNLKLFEQLATSF
jgi:hypothetical protein